VYYYVKLATRIIVAIDDLTSPHTIASWKILDQEIAESIFAQSALSALMTNF